LESTLEKGLDCAAAGGNTRPGLVGPAGRPTRGLDTVESPLVASSAGDEPAQPVSIQRGAGRRRGTTGVLVPGEYAREGPVHRTAGSQDLSALVAAEPGLQSGRLSIPRG